jgi:hypothetical protein
MRKSKNPKQSKNIEVYDETSEQPEPNAAFGDGGALSDIEPPRYFQLPDGLGLDPFELEIELADFDRGSFAAMIAEDLRLEDEKDGEFAEEDADLLALGVGLAQHIRSQDGIVCPLSADDADALNLTVSEFNSANFAIEAIGYEQKMMTSVMGFTPVPHPKLDNGLFVASAIHAGAMPVAYIGVLLRWLLKLLRILWTAIRNLWRARKRLKAAKRLHGRWMRKVAQGSMTRLQYLAKLALLIEESKEIQIIIAAIAAINESIEEAEKDLKDAKDSDTKKEVEDLIKKLKEQREKLRKEQSRLEAEKKKLQKEHDAKSKSGK